MSMGKTIIVAASLSFLGAVLVSHAATMVAAASVDPLEARAAPSVGSPIGPVGR